MEHHPRGSRPGRAASAEDFTGEVTMQPLAAAAEPGRHRVALVTFKPGARTNWHTHPYGQTLYVVSGRGRAGTEGGPVVGFGPGDVLHFAAGERHWHGAAPDAEMSHLAIGEAKDGATAYWEEPVSDADYGG